MLIWGWTWTTGAWFFGFFPLMFMKCSFFLDNTFKFLGPMFDKIVIQSQALDFARHKNLLILSVGILEWYAYSLVYIIDVTVLNVTMLIWCWNAEPQAPVLFLFRSLLFMKFSFFLNNTFKFLGPMFDKIVTQP